MTPEQIAAIFFTFALTLFFFGMAPPQLGNPFARGQAQRSMRERMQRQLRMAGIFDESPTFFIWGFVILSAILGLVLAMFLQTIIIIPLAPVVVIAIGHWFIMQRQRGYMQRATDELIPFFNRMATAVSSGRPAQSAYLEAVADANELRPILEDSAAKITSGMRFTDALSETLALLPLRMWAIFVNQMRLYDEMGGDVTMAINITVTQVNEMLALQAEARADYSIQARQQKLIVGIGFGSALLFGVLVDAKALITAFTSPIGIVLMVLSLSVMTGGMWFSRKQIKDIETKMNF